MPLKNFKTLQIIAGGNILKKVISLLLSILIDNNNRCTFNCFGSKLYGKNWFLKVFLVIMLKNLTNYIINIHIGFLNRLWLILIGNQQLTANVQNIQISLFLNRQQAIHLCFANVQRCHKNGKYVIQEASDWGLCFKECCWILYGPKEFPWWKT